MRYAEKQSDWNPEGTGYYDVVYEQSFDILRQELGRDPTELELERHICATIEDAQLERMENYYV